MKPFGKHVRNYYVCVRTICEPSDGCQLYVTGLYLLTLTLSGENLHKNYDHLWFIHQFILH